jgi:small-conductance mechanosensitive channel
MSTKQILSWLLLLFGEAIIVAAFILFRGGAEDNVFVMNIVVASIVYLLIFFGFRVPWIDLRDKSGRQVGALGISWFATGWYAVFAIAAMICGRVFLLTFTIQLIIHSVLLFLLLLGLFFSRHAADKVQDVHRQQSENHDGVGDRPLSSFVQNNREQQNIKQ